MGRTEINKLGRDLEKERKKEKTIEWPRGRENCLGDTRVACTFHVDKKIRLIALSMKAFNEVSLETPAPLVWAKFQRSF